MKLNEYTVRSYDKHSAARRGAIVVMAVFVVLGMFSSRALSQSSPFFKGEVEAPPSQEDLPKIVQNVGFDQHLGDKVDLSLPVRDEHGNWKTLGSYFGSTPVILVMAYYDCPHLCTMVMNGVFSCMKPLSLEPGKDYQIVSVSINPNETPDLALQKKMAYVNGFHEAKYVDGYHFLTAPESTIQTLTKQVGFRYAYDSANHQYAHASGIMVLTPDGTISRYFFGVEFAPVDLKFGLMDASGGKIGNLADKLLLYCCQYDPMTTKYGFVISRALKIGGTLMILAMGIMFYWLHRRVKAAQLRASEASGTLQIRNA